MAIKIKFIGSLRNLSGKKQLSLPFKEGTLVKNLISKICQEIPEFKTAFSDSELNNSRFNTLILINGKEISVLKGYDTQLSDDDEIVFVPVVHGG